MAEAAISTVALAKLFNDFKSNLLDRDEDHLRDALAGLNLVDIAPAVPARDENLALVVRIDQPGKVAKYQAVFVAKPRARQQDRGKTGIADVNCDPCRYKHCLPRRHSQCRIDAGAHIQSRRSASRIVRQWYGIAHTRVQYLQLD